MFYVYKITNLINGKIYIGKTDDISKRWKQHCQTAARGKDKANYDGKGRFTAIHGSIRKHGANNFKIEELYQNEDEQNVLDTEICLIAEFNSMDRSIGYNLTIGGDGIKGYKYSDEQKKKMSELKKVIFLGEKNPFYGKKHSDEAKKKMSKAHTGQNIGEKNPFYGKKHSLETLAKISAKQKYAVTTEQAKEIHQKFDPTRCTQEQLSKEYNTSVTTIRKILRCQGDYSYCKDFQNQFIERGNQAYLTNNQCKEIIQIYSQNKTNQKEIAKQYNVSSRTINCVVNARGTYSFCKDWVIPRVKIEKKKKDKINKYNYNTITPEMLKIIKQKFKPRIYTLPMLAKEYNISKNTLVYHLNKKGK